MSYNNSRGQRNSFVQEKHVLESEASCEDHVGKRSQRRRKIEETNLSLRKCCNLKGPLKNIKSRRTRRRRRQNLKVVEHIFKGTANNQSRKKTQKKKSSTIKKSDCKVAVPSPIDFDSNTP